AAAKPQAAEGERDVETDRPQTRRLRAWPTDPDAARRHRTLDGLLGDRHALLAAAWRLRRNRRTNPRTRPARRGHARRRSRHHSLLAYSRRGRTRGASRPAARGLPGHAAPAGERS